jgi:hypothetical protein
MTRPASSREREAKKLFWFVGIFTCISLKDFDLTLLTNNNNLRNDNRKDCRRLPCFQNKKKQNGIPTRSVALFLFVICQKISTLVDRTEGQRCYRKERKRPFKRAWGNSVSYLHTISFKIYLPAGIIPVELIFLLFTCVWMIVNNGKAQKDNLIFGNFYDTKIYKIISGRLCVRVCLLLFPFAAHYKKKMYFKRRTRRF